VWGGAPRFILCAVSIVTPAIKGTIRDIIHFDLPCVRGPVLRFSATLGAQ